MLDILGSPGTRVGLALRLSQFVCATGSAVAMMFAAYRFFAFRFLAYEMIALALWGLILSIIDILSLTGNWDLHNVDNAWIYAIGDTILAVGSLAAASSSGGIVVLLQIDMKFCSVHSSLQCMLFLLSIIMGSLAWISVTASTLSTTWLLAQLYN